MAATALRPTWGRDLEGPAHAAKEISNTAGKGILKAPSFFSEQNVATEHLKTLLSPRTHYT